LDRQTDVNRKGTFIAALVSLGVASLLVPVTLRFLEKDACADAGGVVDQATRRCNGFSGFVPLPERSLSPLAWIALILPAWLGSAIAFWLTSWFVLRLWSRRG
jgi:hypothetical protein